VSVMLLVLQFQENTFDFGNELCTVLRISAKI
jgi:hypothetical protein